MIPQPPLGAFTLLVCAITAGLAPLLTPARSATAAVSPLDPCKLLSAAEVAMALPKNDGGEIEHAGGSLVKGIDAYQCSYTSPDVHIFTVVVNIAADDKLFADLKPHFFRGEATEVPVGTAGWLRGEPDDMKLTAIKGRTRLDLELLAPDAKVKGPVLVKLGQAAMAHL